MFYQCFADSSSNRTLGILWSQFVSVNKQWLSLCVSENVGRDAQKRSTFSNSPRRARLSHCRTGAPRCTHSRVYNALYEDTLQWALSNKETQSETTVWGHAPVSIVWQGDQVWDFKRDYSSSVMLLNFTYVQTKQQHKLSTIPLNIFFFWILMQRLFLAFNEVFSYF